MAPAKASRTAAKRPSPSSSSREVAGAVEQHERADAGDDEREHPARARRAGRRARGRAAGSTATRSTTAAVEHGAAPCSERVDERRGGHERGDEEDARAERRGERRDATAPSGERDEERRAWRPPSASGAASLVAGGYPGAFRAAAAFTVFYGRRPVRAAHGRRRRGYCSCTSPSRQVGEQRERARHLGRARRRGSSRGSWPSPLLSPTSSAPSAAKASSSVTSSPAKNTAVRLGVVGAGARPPRPWSSSAPRTRARSCPRAR